MLNRLIEGGIAFVRRSGGKPPADRVPRIFVDISTLYRHDAGTGIQRVVREVLARLPNEMGADFHVVPVYASKRRGYRYCDVRRIGGLEQGFVQRGGVDALIRPVANDIFLGLDLSAHLLPRHERQIAGWKRRGTVIALVAYDLLPLNMPRFFTDKGVEHFRAWFDFLVRQADLIICISRTIAAEVQLVVPQHIAVAAMRLGAEISVDRMSTLPVEEDGSSNALPMPQKPFVLMVGTIEPRKGYAVALDAFDWLWQLDGKDGPVPSLVIVGRAGWKSEAVQDRLRSHPEVGRRLFWFDNADDKLLDRLYREADGLLISSVGEGLGLPIIEALARGTPVLARNLPVFREAGGVSVHFFSDDCPEALGNALVRLVESGRSMLAAPIRAPWSDTVADIRTALSGCTFVERP